jgi:AcrR family transcriptional regulator
MASVKPVATKEAVAKAAVRCFKRFGVRKTSMVDVAEAANLSRQTIYRLFESRPALLAYIAGQRIQAMGEVLKPYFAELDNLEEALVEGSLRSIAVGDKDTLFREIVADSGEHELEQFIFKGTTDIQQMMVSLWSPVLDKARERRQLHDGVSNEEAVEWIRNQHATMSVRDDYDEAKQRQILSRFLVPSLMTRPESKA